MTRTHAHTPTTERYIQTAAVVGSNFTMVLPLIFAWRRFGINHKHSWSVPIFILTAVSSTVYHYADTWAQPVLGLSAGAQLPVRHCKLQRSRWQRSLKCDKLFSGQWHRIDNLGAIGSMQVCYVAMRRGHRLEAVFVTSRQLCVARRSLSYFRTQSPHSCPR